MRTEHFGGEAGDMLLAACSVTDATVDQLAAATGLSTERVIDLIEGPEREGIVRIDGKGVVFNHPLLPAASTPTRARRVAAACWNLSSFYRKLAVRTRAELASRASELADE